MNKLQRLKKKTLRIATICGLATLGCILLAAAASFYNSDLEETANKLKMQETGMVATHNQILQRYADTQQIIATYEEINPSHNPLFGTLDRKNASILLETLNQQYKIKNLSLDISPAVLQIAAPYQRKTGGVNTSIVKISFESMTDEYAYSVMRDIIASFPGFLRVTTVNLTKSGAISDEILYAVKNGEIPPNVKSEFAFDWLGLEVKNNDATTPPPPPAP